MKLIIDYCLLINRALSRLWRMYMAGARANEFPIRKYGLFGERISKSWSHR